MTIDDLIRKAAADAESCYNNRTAGDYTFIGMFAKFLVDLASDPEALAALDGFKV